MKKFCLLIICLICSIGIAKAYVSTDEMLSEEFLKNDGYSTETYKMVRTRTNGAEVREEAERKKNENKFLYYLKKCYVYLDPYADNEMFGHDEIKFNPTWDEI